AISVAREQSEGRQTTSGRQTTALEAMPRLAASRPRRRRVHSGLHSRLARIRTLPACTCPSACALTTSWAPWWLRKRVDSLSTDQDGMRARVDKKERPIARSAQVRRSRGARAPPRADAATSRPEHGSAAPVVARARAAGAGRAPACRATRARPPPGAERTVAVAGLHDPLRRLARDRVERLL